MVVVAADWRSSGGCVMVVVAFSRCGPGVGRGWAAWASRLIKGVVMGIP